MGLILDPTGAALYEGGHAKHAQLPQPLPAGPGLQPFCLRLASLAGRGSERHKTDEGRARGGPEAGARGIVRGPAGDWQPRGFPVPGGAGRPFPAPRARDGPPAAAAAIGGAGRGGGAARAQPSALPPARPPPAVLRGEPRWAPQAAREGGPLQPSTPPPPPPCSRSSPEFLGPGSSCEAMGSSRCSRSSSSRA
ncbi:sterile alpha motif domain-containing protein 1-like [Sphaerodactylus townsendi]|uniref:sterile alpha motif domain-containing protein 1-like n=1 Tax=Sphaerodactylus townsendi TaxID=933632 RepID=UPI002026D432|nr:sterile alpha motif domain-containing protein 1-like [Sphaerodactylus townsendi]